MKTLLALGLAVGLLSSLSVDAADKAKKQAFNVSGHGKTALVPNEQRKKASYDGAYYFSPGVRAGEFIFISGVVAGAYSDKGPIGKEEFKKSIKRAFQAIEETLAAGNASLNQIVKMRTFHVFDSKWITISKTEQIKAVAEVRAELMDEPHPAWTAVGTTALFPDTGLVEIEVVVYAPEKENGKRD